MVNSWVVGQKGEFAVIVTPTRQTPVISCILPGKGDDAVTQHQEWRK